MKAIRIHKQGGANILVYEDAPTPHPKEGEVLVRVYAAAVTPTELVWPTTWQTGAGAERSLPIPGHDFSGVVAEVGPGVSGWEVGAPVYALTDFARDGAEAEYTLALPAELAAKPPSLTFEEAAVAPLSALTAWQALFEHAGLASGQSILIHGAAGAVGTLAVQLAHWQGAYVIGTASSANLPLIRSLGADQGIDYRVTPFDAVVREVDVVLDTVGGATLKRSWDVLKPGGMLVSIVSAKVEEQAAEHAVRAAYFIVRPDGAQLARIGDLIDSGALHPVIDVTFPLSQAGRAYEYRHQHGKTVLSIAE
jgi:NADPH:quinone reductase-like Zn-dependent oxidoreductase